MIFQFDAFTYTALPIAAIEGIRTARTLKQLGRKNSAAVGLFDAIVLCAAAAAQSVWLFAVLGFVHTLSLCTRHRGMWTRAFIKLGFLIAGLAFLVANSGHWDMSNLVADAASIPSQWREAIVAMLSFAVWVGIMPVKVSHEPTQTLSAPLTLTAFARIAVPLVALEPDAHSLLVGIAIFLCLICALWLLSASLRVNHFEPATFVSEVIVCERGVLLAFVWVGLASGELLAGVGALLAWWGSSLTLLALEGSMRQRPLPKGMAFFAMAMAVGLPGTAGFISGDLLAEGLLDTRPQLAGFFVAAVAINAIALYLAVVRQASESPRTTKPRLHMLVPSVASLVIGLFPQPFVSLAAAALKVIAEK